MKRPPRLRPALRRTLLPALFGALFGALAVLGGLAVSYRWDTPTGPTIVSVAAGGFLLATAVGGLRKRL